MCPIKFLLILNEAVIQDLCDLALYRGSLIVFIFLGAGRKDSRYFTLLSTGLKKKQGLAMLKTTEAVLFLPERARL